MSGANLILDPNDEEVKNMAFAETVAGILQKYYPKHLWAVSVKSGVVVIKNLALAGDWAYILHLNKLPNDFTALENKVMLAGGELLERYRVHRGKADFTSMHNTVRRDFAGRAIHDE